MYLGNKKYIFLFFIKFCDILQLGGDEQLVIELGNVGIGLGEDHLNQVHCRSEKRPVCVHVLEHVL